MKYSFMSFSCPGFEFSQLLHTAQRYGYQGIEPRIDAGHKHGIEVTAGNQALHEAKRRAEDAGICICCIATSCSFSNPSQSARNIDYAKRSVDLAAEVNCPVIRIFGGAIPENTERMACMETIVESLHMLAAYAMQRNVILCIETHDDWCDPKTVRDIVERVNSPAVAVNWDIMHPVLSASVPVEEAFRALRPWIRHVHVHDGYKKGSDLIFAPIGEGDVDHRTAIRLLKDSGYGGFISGEWIDWEPYDVHLPREIATMKSFESEDRKGLG